MATGNNQLTTFILTGGEDFVTPPLEIPDGKARIAYNYEQNYDTGFSRIAGYRDLVTATMPGEDEIRGLVIYDNDIYMFRNHVGGATCGMWKATPATYDGDGVLLTPGSWTEITNIVDASSVATTLNPDGYFEFVEHNFKATVSEYGGYKGDYLANEDYIIGDIVTDVAGDLGAVGLTYECLSNHKAPAAMVAGNWQLLAWTTTAASDAHNVTGTSGKLYGVDGKNPAWEFNGTQLKQINSTYTPDVPQHISANGNRLALGFRAGEIAFSVLGDPHSFDPVYGAGSIGVTDYLTGMIPGPDGALYILCRDKTYIYTGMSGPLSQTNLRKYSRTVGAYPYTLQTLAGHTLFYDTWGLTELEVSDKFGDVVSNSLSSSIQNILVGEQPLTSVVLKAKAQYRMYFQSTVGGNTASTCIMATLIRGENLGFTHAVYPEDIYTSASGEINNVEWNLTGTRDGRIFHMDAGNSFDGEVYTSFLTLPFNFMKSPHRVKKFRKCKITIDTLGDFTIYAAADFSFGNKGVPKDVFSADVDPRGANWGLGTWSQFYWGGGYADTVETYMEGHGENVSVTISLTSSTAPPHTLKDISFIYQNLRIEH